VIVYVDTSVLATVYLRDDERADELRQAILHGADPMATSELTEVELTSALVRAQREGRVSADDVGALWGLFEADSSDLGPISITPLDRETWSLARAFLLRTAARSLDVIHIAAAGLIGERSQQEVAVLTRDRRQAQAAQALGFELHPACGL
jgi:predicted nucleic acid-binding protein